MKLINQLQTHFFKTKAFKGLLSSYINQPDSVVVSREAAGDIVKSSLPEMIEKGVQEEIKKAEMLSKKEAMRYRLPSRVNSNTNPDRKPLGSVPFSYLRRMAVTYPIVRACINRRVRQITQLEWDVTTDDNVENEKGFETQINQVKDFLKSPIGHRTRLRQMLTILIDDVLTIDATCFEIQKTRGGEFMHLIPVDPTTIALRVTETGGTPLPPDHAYVQFIQGQKLAGFTTDEMVYDMMGNRSYSPYGLAPLESLIIQVESAISGALYNFNYYKESNVPEGFIYLPDEVASSKAQVEEWQMWFDAIVAGDPRFTHRLKIMPGGAKYEPVKKPDDMAFEKFELWLLQQTCAVFDVPPRDIGITYQVNKSSDSTQADLSRERGLIPLGNFIKEMLDRVIKEDMGYEFLQFEWRNINPVDRKEEIDIAAKEIEAGVLSGDEYRISQGQEPIGLVHYIKTGSGPLKVTDFIEGKNLAVVDPEPKSEDKDNEDEAEEAEKLELADIHKWRKCIYNDLLKGKKLRTRFPSDHIDPETHGKIQKALKGVTSRHQAKLLFDEYIDPKVKASMTLLRYASKLRDIEYDFTTPTKH